jgi:hypothetical protein
LSGGAFGDVAPLDRNFKAARRRFRAVRAEARVSRHVDPHRAPEYLPRPVCCSEHTGLRDEFSLNFAATAALRSVSSVD